MVDTQRRDAARSGGMFSRVWAGLVIVWSVIRTVIVWAAVGDYGLNPWIYLSHRPGLRHVDAFTTPRMVLYFIDDHYKLAVKWGVISLVAFIIPDLYIFLGTRRCRPGSSWSCARSSDRCSRSASSAWSARSARAAPSVPRARTKPPCTSCLNCGHESSHPLPEPHRQHVEGRRADRRHLQQEGWGITAVTRVRSRTTRQFQEADVVIVGTWVHGLFVVGQAPWGLGELAKLPAMKGKMAAAFCTFALNPGKSLDKMTGVLDTLGAEVLGGLALHRAKLPHTPRSSLPASSSAPANWCNSGPDGAVHDYGQQSWASNRSARSG